MKRYQAGLLVMGLLICSFAAIAQKNEALIVFKQGAVLPSKNINKATIDSLNLQAPRFSNRLLFVLVFESLPGEEEKKILHAAGIELSDYIPNKAFIALLNGRLDADLLRRVHVRTVMPLAAAQKLDPSFNNGRLPYWASKQAGTLDLIASIPRAFDLAAVTDALQKNGCTVKAVDASADYKITLNIRASQLEMLMALPFVKYIEPVAPEPVLLNYNSRSASRANLLNAAASSGGRALNGEGVTLAVIDNVGSAGQIDFAGRIIERNTSNIAVHGIHVLGTAAGAGIVNEMYRGYAPKSHVLTYFGQGLLPAYHINDFHLVVSNNSYGGGFDCINHSVYNTTSQLIDQGAFDFPQLLNVFAAGNNGEDPCGPYPQGMGTIHSGWQAAKNTLVVGATDDSNYIASFSAKGPVHDGRIKPEITAMGKQVISTWTTNIYSYDNGTSMACPAVTGGAALLVQRYRQLNGNADPQNGLVKALLCNGADDKGHHGPDYTYGFGVMNLLRSVEMIEGHRYFSGNVGNAALNTHAITVPANTAQLKVMLYWNDPPGSLLSQQALVNDLDLEVQDANGQTVLPLVLDTLPSHVDLPAVNGADHLNNIEQVLMDDPAPGSYTLKVRGTAIAQNPAQEYFLVYDIVPRSLQLTYPVGGEAVEPGEFMKISWDAYGDTTHTFRLEYSADDGNSWTSIDQNISGARRIYTWPVPGTVTAQARIRISQNNSSFSSTSAAFTVIGTPVASLASTQCESYIGLQWNAVPGATDYELMILQGDEMVPVATTSSTSYSFNSLSKDKTYWVGVRARFNGKAGRRSVSLSRKPDSGNCTGSVSDNDLQLQAILSPVTGRKFTSSALKANHVVSLRIKNLDDAPASNYTVQYSINGGNWVTENGQVPIAAGASEDHSFAIPVDLSGFDSLRITAVVKNALPDAATKNDSAFLLVKNFNNAPIDLSNIFLDDLENASMSTYTSDTTGLTGIDRYDFQAASKTGELNTFVNTGIAYSGNRSLVMGESFFHSAPAGFNYASGTYNLSNYTVALNDLRLDFRYLKTMFGTAGDNAVWIRGRDTDPWIKLWEIPRTDTNYRLSPSLFIADTLAAHGQDFSSSFGIRWSQSFVFQSLMKQRIYSIDDIRLYENTDDVSAISIDTPATMGCALLAQVPVKVTIHNNDVKTLFNIPVKYSVNGGPWMEEVIPSLAAKSNLPYSFSSFLNLSVPGSYTVRLVVSYPSDNYRLNDTVSSTIYAVNKITAPSLQNFESGSLGWFAEGQNSSWEFGTPASVKINRAASGSHAWKTKLSGSYSNNELSYLYSPCFDVSGMTRATISFSMAMDVPNCGATNCDGAWLEYSLDGKTWSLLSASGNFNWYTIFSRWSKQDYNWHVATCPLPAAATGLVRFRFVFSSDGSGTGEGIAIDDIHVYDNAKGIYDGATMTTAVSQNISGNGWIDFVQGGKLIASIQPNGQNMGTTDVQAYINTGAVRYTASQYYHDRNITIKPQNNTPADSVSVRFYFLDKETDTLIRASGCGGCSKPSTAYDLGVSKYRHADISFENGTISDNTGGSWSYIPPSGLTLVPFDKGYYAEFKVKDFSEFWLNNGGMDHLYSLPVHLISFKAVREKNNAVLQWKTENESNLAVYEVELARGNEALRTGQFEKIGEKLARDLAPLQQYDFTDNEAGKQGARYYRLKLRDRDGHFSYSPVRSVLFDDVNNFFVYPNPVTTLFTLGYQLPEGDKAEWQLFDAGGRVVMRQSIRGNGFPQQLTVDMHKQAAGVYLLRIKGSSGEQSFKLYRQ